MSKTGVHGMGMIAVPLLALIFGGRNSSGVMLIILTIADIFAIIYYRKHLNKHHLFRLLPWAFLGVLVGTYIGGKIDDNQFRYIMGTIVIVSLGIMIWMEKSGTEFLPKGLWFAILLGILGGITTMVGNLAGSVMALYLLTMRLPKNEYIGTSAWFFMIINWIKIPFHVFAWQTVTFESVALDLMLIPFVGLGALIGIKLVKMIPDQKYRWLIILMTFVAAIAMFFK